MKILHISTLDHGGAAKACIRLHKGLVELGIDSNILFREQTDQSLINSYEYVSPVTSYSFGKRIKSLQNRFVTQLNPFPKRRLVSHQDRIKNRSAELEIFTPPYAKYNLLSQQIYQEADIIHLHWASYFLDYPSFFAQTDKKLVWTLHDMNPFTAGCHYAGDCSKFTSACEVCPQLAGTGHETYSHELFHIKQRALSHTHLTIVSPSLWMKENARKSMLFKHFSHVHIPYDLNHLHFKPLNKLYSREQLNLPLHKKIVLFVADDMSKTRKGFHLLHNILNKIDDSNVVLCAVGAASSTQLTSTNIIYLGKLTDEQLMAAAYSAADVFIAPSLQDNLPNTIIESILCGTPVIAFPVGGIPDIVKHGANGILCDDLSENSLQNALHDFLTDKYSFQKDDIRKDAINRFATPRQASAYVSLYQSIMNKLS